MDVRQLRTVTQFGHGTKAPSGGKWGKLKSSWCSMCQAVCSATVQRKGHFILSIKVWLSCWVVVLSFIHISTLWRSVLYNYFECQPRMPGRVAVWPQREHSCLVWGAAAAQMASCSSTELWILWIELQTRSQQGWRRGSSGGARLTSTKALNSNPNTTKKKKKRSIMSVFQK